MKQRDFIESYLTIVYICVINNSPNFLIFNTGYSRVVAIILSPPGISICLLVKFASAPEGH